jgi:uncharacterized membrane protein
MPGLAATDPESAIKAMQGINAVVRNATFAFSFFGTLVLGAFMVTLLYSVPLNEWLATITPTAENAPDVWRDYFEP